MSTTSTRRGRLTAEQVLLQLAPWNVSGDDELGDSEDESSSEGKQSDEDLHFDNDNFTPPPPKRWRGPSWCRNIKGPDQLS